MGYGSHHGDPVNKQYCQWAEFEFHVGDLLSHDRPNLSAELSVELSCKLLPTYYAHKGFNAVQRIAVEFIVVQCISLHCSALLVTAVQCSAVDCKAVQCNAGHCTAVQFWGLESSAVLVTTVQCCSL